MELSDRELNLADRIDNRCAEESNLTRGVLCGSCKHGQVMRRRGKLDLIVWCHRAFDAHIEVPADLAECSEYESRSSMSVRTMADIALPVDGRPGVHDRSYL